MSKIFLSRGGSFDNSPLITYHIFIKNKSEYLAEEVSFENSNKAV